MQRPPAETGSAPDSPVKHDPYSALRDGNFRRYLVGNLVSILGLQMQGVAVGWEIFERTRSALALGLVGLIQVAPLIALGLVTGHVADRFDRKRIVIVSYAVIAATSLGLATISLAQRPTWGIYACLLASSVARAFQQPAKSSLLPHIVSRANFPNALTWSTSGFQFSAALGPALGGMLIWLFHSAYPVYLADALAALFFMVLLVGVTSTAAAREHQSLTLRSLAAGVGFVWRNQVLLGAMSLDLFAVLLGGATTLLPIYADTILHVGPSGLGWLRAAPAIGALPMSFLLAHRPPFQRAGRTLLWAVTGFGAATIVFGVSRWFPLSLAMLLLTGAFDYVSVVVRHTLVQLLTPDEMRGRVSAVNGMFIGASNELGGFESGLVAALFGPIVSVASGGIGTLVVVALAAALWPQLRRYGRLAPREEPRE